MIIIKIIFLYFIEIAHTDDFPLTGTWLVSLKCGEHFIAFSRGNKTVDSLQYMNSFPLVGNA